MNIFKPRYPYIFAFSLIFLTELLSFAAYFLPAWQIYLLTASFLAVFLLSLVSLEAGVLIAVVELVIGSKGHLFSAEIFGVSFSLRLAIWLALMLASFIYIYRCGFLASWKLYGKKYRYWLSLILILFFVIFGFLQGLYQGYSLTTIFSDGNAWLYLGLIVPILLVYQDAELVKRKRLLRVFYLAVAWLSFKTLALLFIFSHNLQIMPDIYLWVRRSGIGEITAMGGGWQRVFIQSQIYAPIAFLMLLWPAVQGDHSSRRQQILNILALSGLTAVIIISMSRSFWLALALAGVLAALISWRLSYKLYFKALAYFVAALVGAACLIFIAVKFPYPNPQAGLSAEALAARLDFSGNEAALASRWSLLPNLWTEIKQAPLLGQGFGATVSYYSQDPRVLAQNPSGWYTTYAFEWAYLDTWLKVGILGLLAFLIWLFLLLFGLWRQAIIETEPVFMALGASLLFLMIVNVFTPYLNHPLGLSFLLFSSCFIKKNSL